MESLSVSLELVVSVTGSLFVLFCAICLASICIDIRTEQKESRREHYQDEDLHSM